MARAFTFDEVDDPDLQWMISDFLNGDPNYILVELEGLPYVLLPTQDVEASQEVFKNIVGGALYHNRDENNGWVSRTGKKRS